MFMLSAMRDALDFPAEAFAGCQPLALLLRPADALFSLLISIFRVAAIFVCLRCIAIDAFDFAARQRLRLFPISPATFSLIATSMPPLRRSIFFARSPFR